MLFCIICLADSSYHTTPGEIPVRPNSRRANKRLGAAVYIAGSSDNTPTTKSATAAADFACPSMTKCCRHRRISCAGCPLQLILDVTISDHYAIRPPDKPSLMAASKDSQQGAGSQARCLVGRKCTLIVLNFSRDPNIVMGNDEEESLVTVLGELHELFDNGTCIIDLKDLQMS